MSWTPPPLHRHLSTIGIGPVFASPPPHSLPPSVEDVPFHHSCTEAQPRTSQQQQRQQQLEEVQTTNAKNEIDGDGVGGVGEPTPDARKAELTWEIVGDIKCTPEDFVVREIALIPPKKSCSVRMLSNASRLKSNELKRKHGWVRKVAGLESGLLESSGNCGVSDDNSGLENDDRKGDLSGENEDGEEKEMMEPKNIACDNCENGGKENENKEMETDSAADTLMGETYSKCQVLDTNEEIDQSENGRTSTPDEEKHGSESATDSSLSSDEQLKNILLHCYSGNHIELNANVGIASGTLTYDQSSTNQDLSVEDAAVEMSLKELLDLQNAAVGEIHRVWSQGLNSNDDTENRPTDEGRGITKESSPADDFSKLGSESEVNPDIVWIPNISSKECEAKEHSRKLHTLLRDVFPLLRTEVSSSGPSNHWCQLRINKTNRTDGVIEGNSETATGNGETSTKATIKPWVCVLIDRTFFEVAPYLANPEFDLLNLYKFRNRGPVAAAFTGDTGRDRQQHRRKNFGKGNRGNKGRRQNQSQQQEISKGENDENEGKSQNNRVLSSEGLVFLHLRPDLPRSERRNIHRLLTGGAGSSRRCFETSTQNNVPLDNTSLGQSKNSSQQVEAESGGGDSNNENGNNAIVQDAGNPTPASTTAIVVKWSRNAIQAQEKKRKRSEELGDNANASKKRATDKGSTNTTSFQRNSPDTSILCVLRKRQVEHQVALQHLVRALRCRTSDIGLAGIKDMQAVTYQYCTIRNVALKRALHANYALRKEKRVELIQMEEVQNYFINRGDLIGNQFEIVIKNLKRIEQIPLSNCMTDTESYIATNGSKAKANWMERAVPCHASHIDEMVRRIRDFGFINFFGEQRVGDAGYSHQVGVRSFDVGRAMLRGDFASAIDLIMTGRSKNIYSPSEDEVKAREVWRTSGGDAKATLKVFPKNQSTMVRERDLLKGLVRYGDGLEAIRCLPHSTRLLWVHGYQSYVWNRAATERVKRWGLFPVVGDLYLEENLDDNDREDNVDFVDDPNKVDISQIVLPLPGYNIKYPSNEIGDFYKQILDDDGIQLTKGNVPEATAKGGYRKLVQKANNVTWQLLPGTRESNVPTSDKENSLVSTARFSFELGSGCYATMLLRELMVTTMVRGNDVKFCHELPRTRIPLPKNKSTVVYSA